MDIGYYRVKLSNLPLGVNYVNFYADDILLCTHKVIIKDFCEGDKYIKYLDSTGKYRFFPFNNKWESNYVPTQIGSSNKLVSNILTAQTNKSSLGYKVQKTISLTAENVEDYELDLLSDLIISPRIYMYVGPGIDLVNETGDNLQDWVEVSISSSDTIIRRRKDQFGKFKIEIELPEHYAITKI